MFGRRLSNKNIGVSESFEGGHPIKRIRYLQTLLGHFWKRSKEEYLTELREKERGIKVVSKPIQVDVVLINQKNSPRCTWSIGRVQRIITSSDGNVRGAVLRTKSGELRRPINLLYFLEMSNLRNDSNENDTENKPEGDARIRRTAAKTGELIRRIAMD